MFPVKPEPGLRSLKGGVAEQGPGSYIAYAKGVTMQGLDPRAPDRAGQQVRRAAAHLLGDSGIRLQHGHSCGSLPEHQFSCPGSPELLPAPLSVVRELPLLGETAPGDASCSLSGRSTCPTAEMPTQAR